MLLLLRSAVEKVEPQKATPYELRRGLKYRGHLVPIGVAWQVCADGTCRGVCSDWQGLLRSADKCATQTFGAASRT